MGAERIQSGSAIRDLDPGIRRDERNQAAFPPDQITW